MEALPVQGLYGRKFVKGDAVADDVTLGDVARAAGVSMAAASRALNGREGVRPEVRERVQIIADGLGYRPNRAAQNLAGGRASVFGLVLGAKELRADVYAASLLQAFVNEADAHDEGLMLIGDTKSPSVAVRNLIRDGLVGGVIISAVAIGERWVEELLDARIPTVLVGAHPRRSDVCVVDVENRQSSRVVVEHMLDSGCDRIATITGRLNRVDASLRLEGWRDAHLAAGVAVDETLVFESDFSREAGYALTGAVMERQPNAVFCGNDEMALGLRSGLIERGLSVPEDISLAGFDGTSASSFDGPAITSVVQPFDELAKTAIETLSALTRSHQPPLVQLVEPEIFWGETTRPRKPPSDEAP